MDVAIDRCPKWKLAARALRACQPRSDDIVDLEWEAAEIKDLKLGLMVMGLPLIANIGCAIGMLLNPPSLVSAIGASVVAAVAGYISYLTQWTTVPDLLMSAPSFSSLMVRRLHLSQAIVAGITGLLPWLLIVEIAIFRLTAAR